MLLRNYVFSLISSHSWRDCASFCFVLPASNDRSCPWVGARPWVQRSKPTFCFKLFFATYTSKYVSNVVSFFSVPVVPFVRFCVSSGRDGSPPLVRDEGLCGSDVTERHNCEDQGGEAAGPLFRDRIRNPVPRQGNSLLPREAILLRRVHAWPQSAWPAAPHLRFAFGWREPPGGRVVSGN